MILEYDHRSIKAISLTDYPSGHLTDLLLPGAAVLRFTKQVLVRSEGIHASWLLESRAKKVESAGKNT